MADGHVSRAQNNGRQRTMSGQNDDLSGQNFGSAVILTGHVHGFQINSTKNLFAVFLEILQ